MNIAYNENVNENFDFEFLYCTDLKNKYHFWTYSFLIWTISTSIYDSLPRLDTPFDWTLVLELYFGLFHLGKTSQKIFVQLKCKLRKLNILLS